MNVKLSKYAKGVVATVFAVITAVITVASAATADDAIDATEWVQMALAGLTAAGVIAIPNKDPEGES